MNLVYPRNKTTQIANRAKKMENQFNDKTIFIIADMMGSWMSKFYRHN
jgi:hypothetical protein